MRGGEPVELARVGAPCVEQPGIDRVLLFERRLGDLRLAQERPGVQLPQRNRQLTVCGRDAPRAHRRDVTLHVLEHGAGDAAQYLRARREAAQRYRQPPDALGRGVVRVAGQPSDLDDRRAHRVAYGVVGRAMASEQQSADRLLERAERDRRVMPLLVSTDPGADRVGTAAARGSPNNRRGRQDMRCERHFLAPKKAEQQPASKRAHVVEALLDARQRRRAERRGLDVVEPHDRDVVRDAEPGVGQRPHQPDRIAVSRDHQRGRPIRRGHHVVACLDAARPVVVGCREQQPWIRGDAVRGQRVQVGRAAVAHISLAEIADEADPGVAVLDQMLHRGERAAMIVR